MPIVAAALGFCLPAGARCADVTAAEILERAAITQSSQHRVLRAALRTEDESIPLRLVLNGPEIRYEFSKPDQVFVVRMGSKSRIEEVTSKGTSRVPTAEYDARVRNTDITYEDLAMRFLYWKDAKILREESIGGVSCYKLQLQPDGTPSQYGTVWAWITKRDGAFVKAECYDRKAQLLARLTVKSVGPPLSDGTRIFKTLWIERMEPGKKKDTAPTILEIKGEEAPR